MTLTDMPDPREYIKWPNGGEATVDRRLAAALHVAEHHLGYLLTVVKGHDVADPGSVSSTTHNGTGVADLSPFDAEHKVRVLDRIGFAAYHRRAIPGLWAEHIHIILRGTGHGLDPAAQRQTESWLRGHDGLAGDGVDPDPWRPDPVPEPFNYAEWWRAGQRRLKLKGLRSRLSTINERISAMRTRRKMVKAKIAKRIKAGA